MTTSGSRVVIDASHPAAPWVRRAREAFELGDVHGCDAACAEAVSLAEDDPRLAAALASNHVARLLELREWARAVDRCDAYLEGPAPEHLPLRVLRAEGLAAYGRAPEAAREAEQVLRRVLVGDGDLAAEEEARLYRVLGVAEGEQGAYSRAVELLERAQRMFEGQGGGERAEHVAREKFRLGVMAGEWEAVEAAVADGSVDAEAEPPAQADTDTDTDTDTGTGHERDTAADDFVYAFALKRLCRYEEALRAMVRCAPREDLPPSMRWPVLREITLLYRAVGRERTARELTPLLTATAAEAPDRAGAEAELARLLDPRAPSGGACMESVQRARSLLDARELDPRKTSADDLDTAERLVAGVRDLAGTDFEVAMWHLAAGELEFKRRNLGEAVAHLRLSIAQAEANRLVEVQVQALRLLGHACFRLSARDGGRRARECWDEARRLEEGILALQVTDEVRRRMSLSIADTFDEWIRGAAAADGEFPVGQATAAVVAAMEAARGASILPEILPDEAGRVRELPRPGDHAGAWGWVGAFVDGQLPRSQAVWLLHAAPDHVHHAVIGRGFLFHVTQTCKREELQRAVDAFSVCCGSEALLERSLEDDEFGTRLAEVARLAGLHRVVERLPGEVRRLAVVAGGLLSDVPLGAVRADGVPLGVRFALSDMPCLSALAPLRHRARQTRGARRLLVSPRPEGTALRVRARRRVTVLDEETSPDASRAAVERSRHHLTLLDRHATPEALRTALAKNRRHHLVRIHAHGRHDHGDAGRSRLQLAPEGPEGAVSADDLEAMDLRGCGTIVFGACESGMALRVGRDERTGFVRAAFVAGAASAVAARWVAPADVAAELLDRFERYARRMPRDLALQRAQRDLHEGAPGTPTEKDPARRHPANWACWTLYGDSGFQTASGPVRHTLRELITGRRHAGAR
ncbi:CHAT domain-containing protein [Streptomyces sp. ODS28]|uniref:CHAT domain-containing protein n=1 Tax=Streptomyces sp. ODS28 TaxID=3136688 RepID=UPI0031F0074A